MSAPTFVGPLSFKPGPNRTLTVWFYLLQGGSLLALEYPSKLDARKARVQILSAGSTISVGSNKVMKGIEVALSYAVAHKNDRPEKAVSAHVPSAV